MTLVELFFLLGTVTLPLIGIRLFTNQFTISDLFYFIALFFLLIYGISHRKHITHVIPFRPFWFPASLILIGGFAASIEAVNPSASIMASIKAWFLYSLWLSMGIFLSREGRGKKIITALIIGSLFTAGVAVKK